MKFLWKWILPRIYTHTPHNQQQCSVQERKNRGIGREKRKASGGAQRARVS